MKSELIDVSPTQKQLVFEVPSDIVDREIARVVRDVGRTVRRQADGFPDISGV